MNNQPKDTKWNKIIGIATVIGLLVAIFAIFGEDILRSKKLVYTILPAYDLGDQVFSGLVIENQGRAGLTEIEVIISGLEFPIITLNIPGPHETVEIVEGGEGEKGLVAKMSRLSEGTSLAIYMLTEGYTTLQPGKTFQITSKEVTGKSSAEIRGTGYVIGWAISISMGIFALLGIIKFYEIMSGKAI